MTKDKKIPYDYKRHLRVSDLAASLLNLTALTDTREEDKEEGRIKFPKKKRDDD